MILVDFTMQTSRTLPSHFSMQRRTTISVTFDALRGSGNSRHVQAQLHPPDYIDYFT